MDTTALDPSHALSGRNPTLLNVVVQYADMDMLRALALASPSLYEALRKCKFGYLSMVVLEAPLSDVQQRVVYNGSNPIPSSTFQLPLDDMVMAPHLEMPSSTPPPSQTQSRGPTFLDRHAFDSWRHLSTFRNDYSHDLTIPDYARNFMARAQSVELVVYRRRLGTHISSYFTDNARHLKHGKPAVVDECTSCVQSNEPVSVTTQYKLHLACSPTTHTQHCDTDDEHIHGDSDSTDSSTDNGCIFAKHRSLEYFEGYGSESRRLVYNLIPSRYGLYLRDLPYEDFPPLQLKIPRNITDTVLENDAAPSNNTGTKNKKSAKRKFSYQDGHLFIVGDLDNTRIVAPRFHNLPLVEQHAPTTSLKVRIVDCVNFNVEDWCNAILGCTIQAVQTWIIHDNALAPQHPQYPAKPADYDECGNNVQINIGHHFPHLTSLVLQQSRLDEVNRCGIDEFIVPIYRSPSIHTPLSHFFIGSDIHLPHLQHFGVVGTLLDPHDYAPIAFNNANVTSLNINPGLQPTDRAHVLRWMTLLNHTLNELEDFDTSPSSDSDDDDQQSFPHRQERDVATLHRPRRKYNFSIDFASSCLESCCPHKTHILTQRASTNAQSQTDDATSVSISPNKDFSQFGQHRMTCALVHNALTNFYVGHTSDSENAYCVSPSRSSSSSSTLVFPLSTTYASTRDISAIIAIARLALRTLTSLEFRCHYCAHANPGSTLFPGASPGDCTATELPPAANALLDITDLTQDGGDTLPRMRTTQYNKEMYMRLRELLHIPPHVVLRL